MRPIYLICVCNFYVYLSKCADLTKVKHVGDEYLQLFRFRIKHIASKLQIWFIYGEKK